MTSATSASRLSRHPERCPGCAASVVVTERRVGLWALWRSWVKGKKWMGNPSLCRHWGLTNWIDNHGGEFLVLLQQLRRPPRQGQGNSGYLRAFQVLWSTFKRSQTACLTDSTMVELRWESFCGLSTWNLQCQICYLDVGSQKDRFGLVPKTACKGCSMKPGRGVRMN